MGAPRGPGLCWRRTARVTVRRPSDQGLYARTDLPPCPLDDGNTTAASRAAPRGVGPPSHPSRSARTQVSRSRPRQQPARVKSNSYEEHIVTTGTVKWFNADKGY